MAFSNADKSRHGRSAQDSLLSILQRCKSLGYIVDFIEEYRLGKAGFTNRKQFYAPFLITFFDNIKWVLFTTTSMRTDRIKGQQWDATNLKEIDNQIAAAYLVYPDGVSEQINHEFLRQNQKYRNKEEYSAIDAIVSQEEINNMIEAYALQNKTAGQKKDIQGNNFESRVADILSFRQNLIKWQNNDNTIEGMHYDLFFNVVECFGLDKNKVQSITATSNSKKIGRLPSGGKPKTDVLATVSYCDGSSDKTFTVSCKRTSKKEVSVHQYPANTFAKVINPDDVVLKNLLEKFQERGNLRDFGLENGIALEKALKPYLEKLSLWVLGGFGGDGNICQCASYILTYDNQTNSSRIHKTVDYYKCLLNAGVKGHFGTLFKWTFASGQRGKSIQLKVQII